MKVSLPRGETAILFAIFFVITGFVAPIAYVNVAPDSHFVEVHDFDASDTHTDATEHTVCFERTVHRPADAEITVELILLRNDGNIVEEDSFEIDAYYQMGRENVIITRQLRTDSLEDGTYRYIHSVEISYYNNRATKQFVFESDAFRVYNSEKELKHANNTRC